jgi:hypothetical protein
MATDYQRLVFEVADLRRKLANMVRVGTVDEVNGDKIRINMGKDDKGKDVMSPYLHQTDRRGGAKTRQYYKKGQNVCLICPDGDVRQAIMTPWSKNKQYQQPGHANKSGQREETYQQDEDKEQQQGQGGGGGSSGGGGGGGGAGGGGGQQAMSLRGSRGHDGEDWWIQENEEQQEQKPDKNDKKRNTEGDKAKVKYRMNKDTGFTARVGKDVRVSAVSGGAKTRAGKTYFVAEKDKDAVMKSPASNYIVAPSLVQVTTGNPRVSVPWRIGSADKDDKVPNDDK